MSYSKLQREYVSLLEDLNINLIKQLKLKSTKDEQEKQSVVYVINQVGTSNYKIGISTNYTERLNLFNVKLPFEIKETDVYKTDDYVKKERELHLFFAEKRLNNSEFFNLTEKDLNDIPYIIYQDDECMDNEIEKVTDFDLLEKARLVGIEKGKLSTSLLQRTLSIGYSRAARLIDTLEAESFISAPDGSKPRAVINHKK